MDLATLNSIVQGQAERNILDSSMAEYLGRCRTMTALLNDCEALRAITLELDSDGNPVSHTGIATGVFKLLLPMSVQSARYLFGLLSIDTSLPRKRGRKPQQETDLTAEVPTVASNEILALPIPPLDDGLVSIETNPSSNCVTVSAQTYQNYKSALKWWHCYESVAMDKVGHLWPIGKDEALKKQISSYKRDVAVIKKRKGMMRQKDGKCPYNRILHQSFKRSKTTMTTMNLFLPFVTDSFLCDLNGSKHLRVPESRTT